mmetsp:Transcript_18859/g.33896  ORF Transcript_18859/g.33896 Transcript_18859/m.33896 type:complete len:254 (-) Transcript_18859:355-1116(-)
MRAWITLLDLSCEILPIITFVSPATIFLPVLLKQQQRPTNNPGHDHQVNDNTNNATCIEMPPLALTTQMLQCFLWGIYAHQLHMMTLLIPNVFGFLLGFIWCTIYPFKVVSTGGLRTQWQMQYAISWGFMVLGLLTVRKMPYLSSTIAAGVGVLMCTYPLPSMHQALNEKNSNLMGSTVMNCCMFANCVVWLIHSSWWVEYDIFLIVANTAGVIVQAGALTVRVIIARGASTKRSAVVKRGDNTELSVSTPLL